MNGVNPLPWLVEYFQLHIRVERILIYKSIFGNFMQSSSVLSRTPKFGSRLAIVPEADGADAPRRILYRGACVLTTAVLGTDYCVRDARCGDPGAGPSTCECTPIYIANLIFTAKFVSQRHIDRHTPQRTSTYHSLDITRYS